MLSTVGMRDTMANFQTFNHLRVYLADLATEKPGRAILFPQYRRERILTYASWRKGFWREPDLSADVKHFHVLLENGGGIDGKRYASLEAGQTFNGVKIKV